MLWQKQELEKAFEEFPQIIANTNRLLNACRIKFTFGDYSRINNQQVFTDSHYNDKELIRVDLSEEPERERR